MALNCIDLAIIGGGAAGYFSAINAAVRNPRFRISIYEASKHPLSKVLISGGGRCNVTNHTPEITELVKNYPRGSKELFGAFSRFATQDTMRWFTEHGVALKVEADKRVFPKSDRSETIAGCLKENARKLGVKVELETKIISIAKESENSNFEILSSKNEKILAKRILLTTGGAKKGYDLAQALAHKIVPPIPSLFSFEIKDPRIANLSGISFENCSLKLIIDKKIKASQDGPILITHWGLSGPAIIKLSALAARELFEINYKAKLLVNFLPEHTENSLFDLFLARRAEHPKRELPADCFLKVAKAFWQSILEHLELAGGLKWAEVSNAKLRAISKELTTAEYQICGKGRFKEEFVNCGGVSLKEVDFKTMQSKLCPGLYFAGEILDIDGLTGGFNFQSAWTTAWIAAEGML